MLSWNMCMSFSILSAMSCTIQLQRFLYYRWFIIMWCNGKKSPVGCADRFVCFRPQFSDIEEVRRGFQGHATESRRVREQEGRPGVRGQAKGRRGPLLLATA